MIPIETATVYRGGGRRWFSAKAAAKAEAAMHFRKRHPCECDDPDYSSAGGYYPDYTCENHGEWRGKFIRRVARLLLKPAQPAPEEQKT